VFRGGYIECLEVVIEWLHVFRGGYRVFMVIVLHRFVIECLEVVIECLGVIVLHWFVIECL